MTNKANLQKLRQAIIKEIPEIVKIVPLQDIKGTLDRVERPITLADVLRVLMKIKLPIEERQDYVATIILINLVSKWNLSKNNLDLESQETIGFLTDLICKKDE